MSSLSLFYSAQGSSLGNGAAHTHSESVFASVKPLETSSQTHTQRCVCMIPNPVTLTILATTGFHICDVEEVLADTGIP